MFSERMEEKKTIVEENEGDEMPPPAPPTSQEKAEIEMMEEQKLKSKFPGNRLWYKIKAFFGTWLDIWWVGFWNPVNKIHYGINKNR